MSDAFFTLLRSQFGAEELSECDSAMDAFVAASATSYRSIRDEVTRYNMKAARLANDGAPSGGDAPAQQRDARSGAGSDSLVDCEAAGTSSAEAWAAATYCVNDECQLHAQMPMSQIFAGRSRFDRLEAEVAVDCRKWATEIVTKHVRSVFPDDLMARDAVVNVSDTRFPTSRRTFLLRPPANVAVHVWRSRRAAQLFHRVLQYLAQVIQDQVGLAPLHVPLACKVAHQGTFVTVLWLPPLLRAEACPTLEGSLAGHLARWLVTSLTGAQPRGDASLPARPSISVYIGGDARMYVVPRPSAFVAMLLQVQPAAAGSAAQPTLSRWRSALCHVPTAPPCLDYTRLVHVAAAAIVNAVQRFEVSLGKVGGLAAAVEKVMEARIVRTVMKAVALPMHWLYAVFTSPHLRGGTVSVPHIVTIAVASEIVLRAAAAVLAAQFRLIKVTQGATIDVHHATRIVAANMILEPLANGGAKAVPREWLEREIMPVVRVKFVDVPAQFVFAPANLAPAAIMRRIGEKLGIEPDVKARQFFRFAAPRAIEVLLAQPPAVVRHLLCPITRPALAFQGAHELVAGVQVLGFTLSDASVVSEVTAYVSESVADATARQDPFPFLRAASLAYLLTRLFPSRACTTQLVETVSQWCRVLRRPPAQGGVEALVGSGLELVSGLLVDCADNSHVLEDAAREYVVLLRARLSPPAPPRRREDDDDDDAASAVAVVLADPLDEVYCVERLRIVSARVSAGAPGAADIADACFAQAKKGFRRLFRFGGFESSGVYFTMMAAELQLDVKTKPFDTVLQSGLVTALAAAASIGADKEQRQEVAARIFTRLMSNVIGWVAADTSSMSTRTCPADGDGAELAQRCAAFSSVALKSQLEVRDTEPTILLCLISHVCALIIVAAPNLDKPVANEALPRVRQLVQLAEEAFGAGSSVAAVRTLLLSDWTLSTLSLLVVTALHSGQWIGAAFVLRALRVTERLAAGASSVAAVGSASLRRPIRIIEQAERMTRIIASHYSRFVARSNVNPRAALLGEALHRRGVVIMEQMARSSLCKWEALAAINQLRVARVSWEEQQSVALLQYFQVRGRFEICRQAEASHRCALYSDESEAFETLFWRRLHLGRYGVRCQYIAAMSEELLRLQHPVRQSIERQQQRAYLGFIREIETAARYGIFLQEQAEVRSTFVAAALRTMRAVAVKAQTGRAVPAVSLYFYAEEEEVRRVIEEEYETAMQEMRLKEKMFRMAVLKHQRMISVSQPKLSQGASPELMERRRLATARVAPLRSTSPEAATTVAPVAKPSLAASPENRDSAQQESSAAALPAVALRVSSKVTNVKGPPPQSVTPPPPGGTKARYKESRSPEPAVPSRHVSMTALDKAALFEMWKSTKAKPRVVLPPLS